MIILSQSLKNLKFLFTILTISQSIFFLQMFFFLTSNAAGDADFTLKPDRDQESKNQTMNIKLYRHKTLKQ